MANPSETPQTPNVGRFVMAFMSEDFSSIRKLLGSGNSIYVQLLMCSFASRETFQLASMLL